MPARSPRRKRLSLLLPCILFTVPLIGCNDSDDDNVPPPPPPGQNSFTAFLDEDQVLTDPVSGTRFRVTVTNRAPNLGTYQTPTWVGFHDGTFELFDVGSAADTYFPTSLALERLAEDGNVDPLRTSFSQTAVGGTQATLEGTLGPDAGPIAPGESVSMVFELDPTSAANRYMSFASMVIPSNDAFIGNEDPQAIEIFDGAGNFVASNFTITGAQVLDAGTEVNTEEPSHTAFFGQTTPNTGDVEGGVVELHPGFLAAGSGGILDDPGFANADFTASGYQVLEVRFEELVDSARATGLATFDLVGNGSQVSFVVTAANLSGPATGVFLRRGLVGEQGVQVLDLTSAIQENEDGHLFAEGTRAVPAGFVTAIRLGEVFVHIPTALNPDGELRGQIEPGEAFVGHLDTTQEVPSPVVGDDVRVTVTNLAPNLGTWQSPVWVGFHVGTFELYDIGAPANQYFPVTNALERLAEDGDVGPLMGEYDFQIAGTTQGVLEGSLGTQPGPIAPGESVSKIFRLQSSAATSQYFSYASMVLPSNDAFIANDGPLAHAMFDLAEGTGPFVGEDFTVSGFEVLDAGTEVNDENPANVPFFGGPTSPNQGTPEAGVVTLHPGFQEPGLGGILDDAMFANANFLTPGYETLRFSFSHLGAGEPGTGTVVARLNETADEIQFIVIVRNLSSEVVGMHFHEAPSGVTGPVVLDLGDTIAESAGGKLLAQGTKAVNADFLEALRNGDIYLNIHTTLNPSGEVRAQMEPIGPAPDETKNTPES